VIVGVPLLNYSVLSTTAVPAALVLTDSMPFSAAAFVLQPYRIACVPIVSG
jgi:hypothetical protein